MDAYLASAICGWLAHLSILIFFKEVNSTELFKRQRREKKVHDKFGDLPCSVSFERKDLFQGPAHLHPKDRHTHLPTYCTSNYSIALSWS